jgi:hypothetical protein
MNADVWGIHDAPLYKRLDLHRSRGILVQEWTFSAGGLISQVI